MLLKHRAKTLLLLSIFLLLVLFATACGGADTTHLPGGDVTTETPLAENEVKIPIYVYKQDPESGEYLLIEEQSGYVTLPKNAAYDPKLEAPDHYELDTEKSIPAIEKATQDSQILYYFKCEICRVTFAAGEDATLTDGSAYQLLRKGQAPQAPTFTRFGYTMTGFDKELDKVYEDTTYTVTWELARYTLRLYATEDTVISDTTFARRNDTPNCFEKTFTIFDSFTIPTPQSLGYTFRSWNAFADGSGDTVTAVAENTGNNLTLYAIYDIKLYAIDFATVDGITYPSYYLPYGTPVSSPYIAPADQKAGYGLNWYEDEACTRLYAFTEMPAEHITLYGKWEIDTGEGFLAFDLEDLTNNTIDSFDELVAFVDYVRFHDLTEAVEMEVTYSDYESIMEDLKKTEVQGQFRANGSVGYTTKTKSVYLHPNTQCIVSIRVANSYRDIEASLSTQPTTESAYDYLVAATVGRGASYRNFYIDSLKNTFPVTTTNQLLYVVEHGYRPLPEAGSSAERVYTAAKALLNEILPANATDLEKVEIIFNYLVLNVQYDQNAVTLAEQDSSTWPHYDAYFLEGVFDNQKAVCDGIAKAFSLLCNIEGIPAVEVAGTGHAWNRVKLNNCWYVADPTFGNLHIKNENRSIMDHSQFLISDADKEAMGYTTESYSYIKAEKNYNYFANKKETIDGKEFDFEINSVDELVLMLRYLSDLKKDLEGFSIDFVYAIKGTAFSSAYNTAIQRLRMQGIRFSYGCTTYAGESNSVYKIIFTKG